MIRAAQHVGLGLEAVAHAFAAVPVDAAPTKRQWAAMSARWRSELDARIVALQQVRDNLGSCVGCGCLPMRQCALCNPQDMLGDSGSGARRMVPGASDRPVRQA